MFVQNTRLVLEILVLRMVAVTGRSLLKPMISYRTSRSGHWLHWYSMYDIFTSGPPLALSPQLASGVGVPVWVPRFINLDGLALRMRTSMDGCMRLSTIMSTTLLPWAVRGTRHGSRLATGIGLHASLPKLSFSPGLGSAS